MRYSDFVESSQLTELFDNPNTWTWGVISTAYAEGEFTIENVGYRVNLQMSTAKMIKATAPDINHKDVWTVEFKQLGKREMDEFGITGAGNSPTVFSTVINMLKEFATMKPVTAYRFLAKERSRQALYDRLSKRLGTQVYNSQTDDGEKIYIVVLNK